MRLECNSGIRLKMKFMERVRVGYGEKLAGPCVG